MRPFWRALAELGIPVYFTLSMGRSKGRDRREDYEGYLNEHRILQRWMDRYPDLTVVLTHGLPWGSFLEGDRIVLPEAIWKIFENPQCHLQLLFPIGLGGRWEYPWLEAEPTIKECVQRIGADRSYTAPTCPWSPGTAPIARPSTSSASTATSCPRASAGRSLEERPLASWVLTHDLLNGTRLHPVLMNVVARSFFSRSQNDYRRSRLLLSRERQGSRISLG